jgi:tellurite resistance protein
MFWKRGIRESLAEVAGACYCMAAIDGEVSADEVRMIRHALAEFTEGRHTPETVQEMIDDAREEIGRRGLDGYLKGFGARLNDEARELVLAAAGATLMADGKIDDRERALFLALSERFGFTPADASDLLNRVIATGTGLPK